MDQPQQDNVEHILPTYVELVFFRLLKSELLTLKLILPKAFIHIWSQEVMIWVLFRYEGDIMIFSTSESL